MKTSMKNTAKGLLVASTLIGASHVTAMGLEDICPYVGAEYEWSRMRTDANHLSLFARPASLNPFYPKSFSGANVFVGGRWCDIGAEIGYTFTGTKSKTQHRGAPQVLATAFTQFTTFSSQAFGSFAPGDTLKTKIKLNGWHIDLNGYVPLCGCWELIGSVGYEWMKPKVNMIGTHRGSNVAAGVPVREALHIHTKYKGMFRLGLGTQYMVTECVGIRAFVRWRNTEKLSVKITNAKTNVEPSIQHVSFRPFKDTLSLAVGTFVRF